MRPRLLIACLLFIPFAVQADERGRLEPEYNIVSLQAQAGREVENDELVAVLAVEAQGDDPAALAEAVNRRMAEALRLAKQAPAVKVRTGNYQTFPRYKGPRIETWQAVQELRLESRDFPAVSRLVGQLQKSLTVKALSVRLSPEARRAAEDALIGEAIAAFQARADLAAKAMKASGWRMRDLHIGAGGPVVHEKFSLSAAARADTSAVAVEGGASQVTVTVSGSVQLRGLP